MSPGGSGSKESACNVEDPGSIPGSGRSPEEGNGNTSIPVFLPGKFHGHRSLAGYSPWVCKESDTTEQLSLLRWWGICLPPLDLKASAMLFIFRYPVLQSMLNKYILKSGNAPEKIRDAEKYLETK